MAVLADILVRYRLDRPRADMLRAGTAVARLANTVHMSAEDIPVQDILLVAAAEVAAVPRDVRTDSSHHPAAGAPGLLGTTQEVAAAYFRPASVCHSRTFSLVPRPRETHTLRSTYHSFTDSRVLGRWCAHEACAR